MSLISHTRVRRWILSQDTYPKHSPESELSGHLSSCSDCQVFAQQVNRQAILLRETFHRRWDVMPEPNLLSRKSIAHIRRNSMVRNSFPLRRALTWTGGLIILIALLAWAIPCLMLRQTCNRLPAIRIPLLFNPDAAQQIDVSASDLGDGWVQTAEKYDLNASYYFDIDQSGYPIIGTHETYTETMLPKDQIETISMRGFAHPGERWTLFSTVIVFRDVAQAEAMAQGNLQKVAYDSDIPDDQYTRQEIDLGDEGWMVSVRNDPDAPPSTRAMAFRKGRVIVTVFTMGLPAGAGLVPEQVHPVAVSEEQLLDIGKKIEARIP